MTLLQFYSCIGSSAPSLESVVTTAVVCAGCNMYLLEDLESPLHLEGLLQLMPTVNELAARLMPKMVQDPFLDSQGQPYSYAKLSRYVHAYKAAYSNGLCKYSIEVCYQI